MLDPVVIGQDDQTELHVQAVIQSGRRHLDIRIWRRGPTGFAPSRNAITLEAADLDALQEGISELLEASNGGRDVARIVWDKDEGRRLRAETEPFGTRFVARLGFWQRVRDSWKPAGDGLVLAADQLGPLQALLRDIRPRLDPTTEPPPVAETSNGEADGDGPIPWPLPGADWLTPEGDRIAFHPRGIRVTAEIEVHEDTLHLVLHQWRRQDTLWLPSDKALDLALPDLDAILRVVRTLSEGSRSEGSSEVLESGEQLALSDGSTLWVRIQDADTHPELHLDRLPPSAEDRADLGYHPYIVMPAEYVPRFGRVLWHARSLLQSRRSAPERPELPSLEEIEAIAESEPEPREPVASIRQTEPHPQHSESVPASVQNRLSGASPDDPEPAVDRDGWVDDWQPREPSDTPERRSVSLGSLKLGHDHVFLFLQEGAERALSLQWEGRSLQLPVENLEDMLSHVRDLYYGTLRGRRGHAIIIGTRPAVTVSVHHHGSVTYLALDQELDGKITHLSFPTHQVPAFLNIAEAALARI